MVLLQQLSVDMLPCKQRVMCSPVDFADYQEVFLRTGITDCVHWAYFRNLSLVAMHGPPRLNMAPLLRYGLAASRAGGCEAWHARKPLGSSV